MKDKDTILLENAYHTILENVYSNITGPQKLLKHIVEYGQDLFDINDEDGQAFYVSMLESNPSYEDVFDAWHKYGSLSTHTLYDLEEIGRELELDQEDIDYMIDLGASAPYSLEQG